MKFPLLIVLLLFISFSCCLKTANTETHYYRFIRIDSCGNKEYVLEYYAALITKHDSIKYITKYTYNPNNENLKKKSNHKYMITTKGLYEFPSKRDSLGQFVLSCNPDTCTRINHPDYEYNQITSRKYCYEGYNIIFRDSEEILCHIFNKETGLGESVFAKVYFDESFNLLREESSGINEYPYIIEAIDTIPEKFMELIIQDQERK